MLLTCLKSKVMVTQWYCLPFWMLGLCHQLLVPSMALEIGCCSVSKQKNSTSLENKSDWTFLTQYICFTQRTISSCHTDIMAEICPQTKRLSLDLAVLSADTRCSHSVRLFLQGNCAHIVDRLKPKHIWLQYTLYSRERVKKDTNSWNKQDPKHVKLAFGIGTVTVTDAALGVAQGPSRDVLHQLAEHLWSLLSTSGIGGDVSIAGQVQNGRKQTLKEIIFISHVVRHEKLAPWQQYPPYFTPHLDALHWGTQEFANQLSQILNLPLHSELIKPWGTTAPLPDSKRDYRAHTQLVWKSVLYTSSLQQQHHWPEQDTPDLKDLRTEL